MTRNELCKKAQEKLEKYTIDIEFTDKNDELYSNYGVYNREDVSIISNDNWEIHIGKNVRILIINNPDCNEYNDVVNFYKEIKDLKIIEEEI